MLQINIYNSAIIYHIKRVKMIFDRYKPMPKGLQKHILSKLLEKNGIAADLIDLDALIDSKLSFNENLHNLENYLKTKLKEMANVEEQEEELEDFNYKQLEEKGNSKDILKEILRILKELPSKISAIEENQKQLQQSFKKIQRASKRAQKSQLSVDLGPKNANAITYQGKPIGFVTSVEIEKPLDYKFIYKLDPYQLRSEIQQRGIKAKEECFECNSKLLTYDGFYLCPNCKSIYAYDVGGKLKLIYRWVLVRYSQANPVLEDKWLYEIPAQWIRLDLEKNGGKN
jgi:hypothetical protein